MRVVDSLLSPRVSAQLCCGSRHVCPSSKSNPQQNCNDVSSATARDAHRQRSYRASQVPFIGGLIPGRFASTHTRMFVALALIEWATIVNVLVAVAALAVPAYPIRAWRRRQATSHVKCSPCWDSDLRRPGPPDMEPAEQRDTWLRSRTALSFTYQLRCGDHATNPQSLAQQKIGRERKGASRGWVGWRTRRDR